MTAKIYRLKDTTGDDWQVLPGDPAHGICDRLAALDWQPRLPWQVIQRGEVLVIDLVAANVMLEAISDASDPDLDQLLLDTHDTMKQLLWLSGLPVDAIKEVAL